MLITIKKVLSSNIITFVLFSTFLVFHFSTDNFISDQAFIKNDIKVCSMAKREYFENLCYQNYCYINKNTPCPHSQKSNNTIIIFEILILWLLASFSLGKAYFNFFDNFIKLKFMRYYRSFQEDEMYFFFRIIAGVILYALLRFIENKVLF